MSYDDTAKAMDDDVWPFQVTDNHEVWPAGAWTEPAGAVAPDARKLDAAGREDVDAVLVADTFYSADEHGGFYFRANDVEDSETAGEVDGA